MGKTDKDLSGIKKMVYDIIVEAYKTGKKENYPDQTQISKKVREIKNKAIDPMWEATEEYEKLREANGFYGSCQPSVSKHLKTLCKDKLIFKLEDDVYIPYNIEVAREELKRIISENITFNRENVYVLASHQENRTDFKGGAAKEKETTYSTCSILIDVRYDYMETAKDLFKQYIGIKNCYDITEFQGKILIMLEGTLSEVQKFRINIRDMVKKGFQRETKDIPKKDGT